MRIDKTGKERNRGTTLVLHREIKVNDSEFKLWRDPKWSSADKSWKFTLSGDSHNYGIEISAPEVLGLLQQALLSNVKLGSHERAHVRSILTYAEEVLLASSQPAKA